MTRSNFCDAMFAKGLDLSLMLSFAIWNYLPYKDSHLYGVMTRSNLCFAMFAKDLDLAPMLLFAIWIHLPYKEQYFWNVMTRHNLCYAMLVDIVKWKRANFRRIATTVLRKWLDHITASLPQRVSKRAFHIGPRLRKREPRSAVAILERKAASSRRTETTCAANQKKNNLERYEIRILHLNITRWISHGLVARIR